MIIMQQKRKLLLQYLQLSDATNHVLAAGQDRKFPILTMFSYIYPVIHTFDLLEFIALMILLLLLNKAIYHIVMISLFVKIDSVYQLATFAVLMFISY